MQNTIPTRLKLLRGRPGHRDRHITAANVHEYEPQPLTLPDVPEAPAYITDYAAEEWRHVATELHRMRLLTTIDLVALAAYCNAYKRWRDAVEMIAEERGTMGLNGNRGLLAKTDSGAFRANPLIKIAAEAAAEMLRFAVEFGLTPVARSRIKLGPNKSGPGKFDGFLAG